MHQIVSRPQDTRLPAALNIITLATFAASLSARALDPVLPHVADEFGVAVNAVSIAHGTATFDAYGQWATQREMEDDGCVLVRPDRFVAYRSTSLAADPLTELRRVLTQILGKPGRTTDSADLGAVGLTA